MSAERIRLSTGATTILRGPLARGKSGASTAAFWASLPELTSAQPDDNDYGQQQDSSSVLPFSSPGAGPPGAALPLPWRDAVITNSGGGGAALFPEVSGPSQRNLANGKLTSSKSMMGMGGGGGGGGSGAGGAMFRRSGVASAPDVVFFPSGVSFADSTDVDRRRLPSISAASRSAAIFGPGMTAGTAPSSAAAAAPPSVSKAGSRRILSLPSIRGSATEVASVPAHAGNGGNSAGAGGAGTGGDGGASSGAGGSGFAAAAATIVEPQPVVVSFAYARPPSVKRSMPRVFSRPVARVTTGGDSAADSGGSGSEYDRPSADASSPASSSAGAQDRGSGGGGGLRGGLLRGIRRLFGKDSPSGGGGGAAAAANPAIDSAQQVDQKSPRSQVHYPAIKVAAQLTCEHAKEQERVNRVRSALFGADMRGIAALMRTGDTIADGASGGVDGGRGSGALGTRVSMPPPPLSRRSLELQSRRLNRCVKSFAQRALEDPSNPAFKTAKQLAAVQEKLSYMDDPSWRAKAAEMVNMERPILMAEGWRV